MIKLVHSFAAVSFLMISAAGFAQNGRHKSSKCKTPIKIEIYDQASRRTANLLKDLVKVNSISKVKVENIVRDEYDRPKLHLPYVYSKPTIHFRKNSDKACVEAAVRSMNSMGFDFKDISYRPYSYGNELDLVRISLPPRTFLYDDNGILTVQRE